MKVNNDFDKLIGRCRCRNHVENYIPRSHNQSRTYYFLPEENVLSEFIWRETEGSEVYSEQFVKETEGSELDSGQFVKRGSEASPIKKLALSFSFFWLIWVASSF